MRDLDFYTAISGPTTLLADQAIDALMHLYNEVLTLREKVNALEDKVSQLQSLSLR